MRKIRQDNLSDSTVTIHLIGAKSAENLGSEEQKFIKGELQASLYNGENNPRSGILGVVLPSMEKRIYEGNFLCANCGSTITRLNLDDSTTIREFHLNYHIPNGMCHWSEDDRYCVLVSWSDFIKDPEKYIEDAFAKRDHAISKKITVRP